MSQPFLAQMRIVSFGFSPRGWAFANGSLLPINQNQALFSLLGTTYGGDGRVNFALPNAQSRIPMHVGNDSILGQAAGAESVVFSTVPTRIPSASIGTAVATPTSPTVQPMQTLSPFLVLNFVIALQGIFPSRN